MSLKVINFHLIVRKTSSNSCQRIFKWVNPIFNLNLNKAYKDYTNKLETGEVIVFNIRCWKNIIELKTFIYEFVAKEFVDCNEPVSNV